jgi:hypothetical protein
MSEELRFAKDMPIRLCTLVRIVIECGQLHQSGVTHPFCLTTPVFLFLLVLFYPKVNAFAYRITAFTGLLYGLFNMTHFFNPQLRWMGILHLPLLVISLCALLLPRVSARARGVA